MTIDLHDPPNILNRSLTLAWRAAPSHSSPTSPTAKHIHTIASRSRVRSKTLRDTYETNCLAGDKLLSWKPPKARLVVDRRLSHSNGSCGSPASCGQHMPIYSIALSYTQSANPLPCGDDIPLLQPVTLSLARYADARNQRPYTHNDARHRGAVACALEFFDKVPPLCCVRSATLDHCCKLHQASGFA